MSDIIWLERTKSTNSALRARKIGLDNLSVIATKSQTAGRGQGDHVWFSGDDTNLSFSVLLRFPKEGEFRLAVSDMLLITEITTLAIRDYLLSRGIEARIKWPNDIWVGDSKICGILIENTLDKELISESIVGIGLNVNQLTWPEGLPNPVSMKELTSKDYVLEDELVALMENFSVRYRSIASQKGRAALDEEFRRYMFRLN